MAAQQPPTQPPQGAWPPPPQGAQPGWPPPPAGQQFGGAPYAPEVPSLPPVSPPGLTSYISYGGFWVRYMALSLDLSILYALTLLLIITFVGILAVPILWLVYLPFFWARGRTPAMKACGMRIVRASDGMPIDMGTAIVRFVIFVLELIACAFLIGLLAFAIAAFDSRKRALHDMLAGTVVVHAQLYPR
jgi:uncharacterized RDD family membrane protein YckC